MSDATKPLQSLLDEISTRLARVEACLDVSNDFVSSSSIAAPAEELPPQLVAYDKYVAQYLPPFVEVATRLSDDTKKLGEVTEKAFACQRAYLLMASQCKKPATINPEHLKDLQICIKEINVLRDNRSEFANHQNMVNEGIQALGWLCVEPAPKPFIESYVGGSDFWGNKIRVQYKNSSADQITFVTAFKNLLTELMVYVKAHHTTGVAWNPKGGDVSSYKPVATFGKTAGLHKVTKDMQTWRKDYECDGGASKLTAPIAFKKPVAPVKISKPALCEERNGNWQIEYQTGQEPLTVNGINMKQQVYIFGCENATILLEGKAKNIVLDSCKKTKLIFDNAVSSIEIVNCKGVQVQCKGVVPSVAIDKTDGCLVYISWEGRDVQFVTSKSSEMNVAFPEGAGSDDYVEKPIPEQFVHKIMDDLTLSSDVSDLYSH
ncbi:adenylyl cyclase-associated [Plasmopara halstedii]|uniref:Adenylyl cyclase-associated n=1 Tax=Plasmopara halstedii TaxID=4781 RepID=A0A0P1ABW3_PLAHL|nr:adenylyl cyclase-associated [Plasmopara halstedii]CEG37951.1 adenylyl cyclase-associated [Plasmopara halstedii]|eukprot:XP_024574320.1 adenylyl cyclase-associated [Plasmopara halstedii]